MNSVEMIDFSSPVTPTWKLFYIEFKANSARHSSIVCPISENAIAVLGGESFGPLSNGIVLNTKTRKERNVLFEG